MSTPLNTPPTGRISRTSGDPTPAYPRDLLGHGRHPPQARWPGNARVGVQFVLNY